MNKLFDAQQRVYDKLIEVTESESYEKFLDKSIYISGEMGVGKTYIGGKLVANFKEKRSIVIVPKTVTKKWKDVILGFDDTVDVEIVDNVSKVNQHKVEIIPSNIRQFKAIIEEIVESNEEIEMIVYDEFHQCINSRLEIFKSLLKNNDAMLFLLTGTIFNVRMSVLYTQLALTNPTIVKVRTQQLKEKFPGFGSVLKTFSSIYSTQVSLFMKDIWQYISVSISLDDVGSQSNDDVEQTILPINYIPLNTEQALTYELAKSALSDNNLDSSAIGKMLSNMIDNPSFDGYFVKKRMKKISKQLKGSAYNKSFKQIGQKELVMMPLSKVELRETEKYKKLLELVNEKIKEDKRTIVYALDHQLIEQLVEELKKDGIEVITLDKIKPDMYAEHINREYDNGKLVAIVDPTLISVGVDIHADLLVMYQFMDDFNELIQSQRRVYRLSSTRSSEVYYLAYDIPQQKDLVIELSNASKNNAAAYGTQETNSLAQLTGILLSGLNE